jgi:hypothetical protein
MRDDERDRERRSSRDRDTSWSEIDKKRDKSPHVDGDQRREKRSRGKAVTGLERYKSGLAALFQRGEASKLVKSVARHGGLEVTGGLPERQQALRAILDASGPPAVAKAVDDFVKKFGELPDDPEVLGQALLHPDDAVVLDALQRLHHFLAGHVLSRKAVLLQRVKEVELRAETDELREAAGKVRDLIGI